MKIDDIVELMNDAFKENKSFIFPINGTSMIPFLRKDDLVELINTSVVKKNDIIFYKRENGQYVLHRIIKVKKDAFVLRGDHQSIKEYPVYKNQIIGKVIKVIKNNKEYELKGFKYKLFLFSLKFWIVRKIYGRMK